MPLPWFFVYQRQNGGQVCLYYKDFWPYVLSTDKEEKGEYSNKYIQSIKFALSRIGKPTWAQVYHHQLIISESKFFKINILYTLLATSSYT